MAGDKSVRTVRDRGYAYALNVKNASVAYTYLGSGFRFCLLPEGEGDQTW